ncbi:MAG: hypothetical protein ABI693_29680, partial [Bryobacteraceae bacterium]
EAQRPIAIVTARGHEPATIEAALELLVKQGFLPAVPPVFGIYPVTNPKTRGRLGVSDPEMSVSAIKKVAIKDAVEQALVRYGSAPPHRFGMSDDDPANIAFAISAMRDCKLKYPHQRFFVINTNHEESAKLEIFPMTHPATRRGGLQEDIFARAVTQIPGPHSRTVKLFGKDVCLSHS